MKSIDLGGCGLKVSAVAMGCMRISGLPEKELDALVFSAIEAGINFFDHADIYGGGACEERFGGLLVKNPGLRERILLQSKCGIRKGFFDFSREHIVKSVEGSLSRLHTDHLDVLLLHRPDTLMEPEEVAGAFSELRDSGKVLHFGVSNQNPMQMALLQKYVRQKLIADQLQFGPAHSLLVDSGINVNMTSPGSVMRDGGALEYCRLNGITIQTWSPFLFGFFEGVFLASDKYAKLNETLAEIGAAHGVSADAAAVAWIARHPAGIQTILGSTKPDRIRSGCRGADVELSREEWYRIYRSAGNILP